MPASLCLQPTRLRERGGSHSGLATLIEFVFAPPAIAMAIGASSECAVSRLDPRHAPAVGPLRLCSMVLYIVGVSMAATFELCVTLLAVVELWSLWASLRLGFSFSNFVLNGWAGSDTFSLEALSGIFAAIFRHLVFPCDKAAMAAEEVKDPATNHSQSLRQRHSDAGGSGDGEWWFCGRGATGRSFQILMIPYPRPWKTVVGDGSGWLQYAGGSVCLG